MSVEIYMKRILIFVIYVLLLSPPARSAGKRFIKRSASVSRGKCIFCKKEMVFKKTDKRNWFKIVHSCGGDEFWTWTGRQFPTKEFNMVKGG